MRDARTGSGRPSIHCRRRTEQFGAGHPEHAPALEPQGRRFAVGVAQDRHQDLPLAVLPLQPMVRRALVVTAVDEPATLEYEVALEAGKGIGRGHQSAGEEMPTQPVSVALRLERIQQRAMAEDVREQLAVGAQPRAYALEQRLVVAQVFEHLDGYAAVETCRRQVEMVDVARQHLHVVQAELAAARFDELALWPRIGNGRDARARVPGGHPQRQRAPAATEFEDVLAIGELRTLAVQSEHRVLRLGQRLVAVRVVARRVLQSRPEAMGEESRRQFIVLPVRRIGVDRQRAFAQRGDAQCEAHRLGFGTAQGLLAQALRALPADPGTQEAVGQPAAFGETEQAGCGMVGVEFERVTSVVMASPRSMVFSETMETASASCAGRHGSRRRGYATPAPR